MFAYSTTILYLRIVVSSVSELNNRLDNKYKKVFLKKKREMKLIIEIDELAFHEERAIGATMKLPGLSKAGVLQVTSEVKTDNILLRHEDFFNRDTPRFYADTIQRYGHLEGAIMNTIREFYKNEGLTEAGSCLYHPKPVEK